MESVTERLGELAELFRRQGWTLALAESCTGGLLSNWVVNFAGVSQFYQGAVVSYARQVKVEVLGVPQSLILALGEVSEPVALRMAKGAAEKLKADWAVAITGVAGPSGGTPEKPVGHVCFAVVGPGFELSRTERFPSSLKRHEIQSRAALFAFDLLVSAVR